MGQAQPQPPFSTNRIPITDLQETVTVRVPMVMSSPWSPPSASITLVVSATSLSRLRPFEGVGPIQDDVDVCWLEIGVHGDRRDDPSYSSGVSGGLDHLKFAGPRSRCARRHQLPRGRVGLPSARSRTGMSSAGSGARSLSDSRRRHHVRRSDGFRDAGDVNEQGAFPKARDIVEEVRSISSESAWLAWGAQWLGWR